MHKQAERSQQSGSSPSLGVTQRRAGEERRRESPAQKFPGADGVDPELGSPRLSVAPRDLIPTLPARGSRSYRLGTARGCGVLLPARLPASAGCTPRSLLLLSARARGGPRARALASRRRLPRGWGGEAPAARAGPGSEDGLRGRGGAGRGGARGRVRMRGLLCFSPSPPPHLPGPGTPLGSVSQPSLEHLSPSPVWDPKSGAFIYGSETGKSKEIKCSLN